MAKTRRSFSSEHKVEAMKLVTEKGQSVAEAARSLGIHENQLRTWKQALEKEGRETPYQAQELLNYKEAQPPQEEQEAMHRREIMRRARSKKRRPALLAELAQRYLAAP